MTSAILNTLISCLPDESKELLQKNEIYISTSLKPPLFNYTAFCKVLSINEISQIIHEVLISKNQPSFALPNSKDKYCLVAKEILKMFMNQVSSLKTLTHYLNLYDLNVLDISFTCLTVQKFIPNFFMSQICYNF